MIAVKPTRPEIAAMTGNNDRVTFAIEMLFEQVALAGGSAAWYDFNNAQSVAANTWTTLDWTSPTLRIGEIAEDMPQGFVSGGRIAVPDRQWFLMRVDIKFSMADATSNILKFGLRDTDGGFGVFAQPAQPTLLGSGVADENTFQLLTFGTRLIPSGALPQVFSDGPVNITSTQGFFVRVGAFA